MTPTTNADTATAALILLGFASAETIFFRGGPLTRSLHEGPPTLVIVIFMIGIATPSLVLAIDGAQRRRTERILRDTRQELGEAREDRPFEELRTTSREGMTTKWTSPSALGHGT